MAQLVQRLPRTQNIAGSSPAKGSSSFSLGKKELSLGVVACICLVSITDYTCISTLCTLLTTVNSQSFCLSFSLSFSQSFSQPVSLSFSQPVSLSFSGSLTLTDCVVPTVYCLSVPSVPNHSPALANGRDSTLGHFTTVLSNRDSLPSYWLDCYESPSKHTSQ